MSADEKGSHLFAGSNGKQQNSLSSISFSMKYGEASFHNENVNGNFQYDKDWMMRELSKYIPDYTRDKCAIVADQLFQILISLKSDAEIQDEIVEVLGFENIEYAGIIFSHRTRVVQSHRDSQSSPLRVNSKVKNKNKTRSENNNQYAEEGLEQPVYVGTNFTKPVRINYPNVYDSLNEVKHTSVAGKLLLPEGSKRSSFKQYEEVSIPLPNPIPIGVGEKLVPIRCLDQYGQAAFKGITELNRIQSIVYTTAYRTNENMLVCAPTGAGKTNVALLTILHEINKNIENGVIQKEKFKIIYVAPMKALAAEMTENFQKRLSVLGVVVKEFTGDMQLTKTEIAQTQMLVTTPEKWDIVTRKGNVDDGVNDVVKMLIIDEVHLLHSDRGPVIEAIVARTLRHVERSQKMIRIIGLSATLPNYLDVARFLRVNPYVGLFYFDQRFRPVPLSMDFIGVKTKNTFQRNNEMDEICYAKALEMVKNGHQVMVFVHARNMTNRTAKALRDLAQNRITLKYFEPPQDELAEGMKMLKSAKAKEIPELFQSGFSIHHAGLIRSDRNLVEKCFAKGLVKVLVCTSTLAWGVNLPAHAVIIKGTEMYDPKRGGFVNIGMLDVLQIFGRAGRPQFDKSGHSVIITSHQKLDHYLSLLTNQLPIESQFIGCLADNLNAEIALGTITNINEAVEWISYTYLYVRMFLNPFEYGIDYMEFEMDSNLSEKRRELITDTAQILDSARLIRFHTRSGTLSSTDLGQIASHYYIKHSTIEEFNDHMKDIMTVSEMLNLISLAQEFEQIKIRDDELEELDRLEHEYCVHPVRGGPENVHGKVNILIQTFLSRGRITSFSLFSDYTYIVQNVTRIARALFNIFLKKNNSIMSGRFLKLCLMLELQQWDTESPLRQFKILSFTLLEKLEKCNLTIDRIREMDPNEIGSLLRFQRMGSLIKRCAEEFPLLSLSADTQPLTPYILRIILRIRADFKWNVAVHGKTVQPFWVWIEDPDTNFLYYSEYFHINRKQVVKNDEYEMVITIPLNEPKPSQYLITVFSDKWLGVKMYHTVPYFDVFVGDEGSRHTDLLPLRPLPKTVLRCPRFEKLYKFSYFNAIQTQIFHTLYHTDYNVLLGAPTGSGKTIAAELAIFRAFLKYPEGKVVYIAPLKALVKERIADWSIRIGKKLHKSVVELTGDVTPDARAIASSTLIVTTPEKWDSISRSWQTRKYVRDVVLMVIDEIHLLGAERGPVLEVIISRTNFIKSHTEMKIRVVGLSTALANANDIAEWLNVNEMGLYNFRPSVRPVPLEVHVQGFPGKHYCPRMASMNRPAFQAIKQYSPCQPVIIFVASRRQTRLTASDLIALLAPEDDPKMWLRMKNQKFNKLLNEIKDDNLKNTLSFGIGQHHAGLHEDDRKKVEELFANQNIQVLITTATLAWGVNFPAHMVIIKGTEYYDGKVHRYADMAITDVLQMMGRAGRPQFDTTGVAVVMVHDVKKNFYKKFLYEPFPVESSLHKSLADHLNAEIVSGTIDSKRSTKEYLQWTYFYRRLRKNPAYYQLTSLDSEDIEGYLKNLINFTLEQLRNANCVSEVKKGNTDKLLPTVYGRIASFYYISYKSMILFQSSLKCDSNLEDIISIASHAEEFAELPVRHNEEITNETLSKSCPVSVSEGSMDSPFTKTFLLIQAHMCRIPFDCSDYKIDLKLVLDQILRVFQAMMDVAAEKGWLACVLRVQLVCQMVIQARWHTDSPFTMMPCIEEGLAEMLQTTFPSPITLPEMLVMTDEIFDETVAKALDLCFNQTTIDTIKRELFSLPILEVEWCLSGSLHLDNPQRDEEGYIVLYVNEICDIEVTLTQVNPQHRSKKYFYHISRMKEAGWYITLGQIESEELLALKRFNIGKKNTITQHIEYVPEKPGRSALTLYIQSDSYLGLDQQYDIPINVLPEAKPVSDFALLDNVKSIAVGYENGVYNLF